MNTTRSGPAEGTPLACQCALPLSRQTLTFVADLLRGHLKKIGSRWRKLPPGKIALIVLAALRHDHRLADMAGGNGVSASTVDRWTWEVIGLLAARAPRLDRALATITREGGEVVLLDGTLIPTRRRTGTANRKNYNGKHKKHGLLFLALTDETGNLIWISSARRGAASEITTARHDHLAARPHAAGLGALADLGFTGLDPDPGDPVIITGYKSTRTRKTTPAQRQANQALSAARAPVEHGFSDLKNWRSLTRLRLDPVRATTLLRALLVLFSVRVYLYQGWVWLECEDLGGQWQCQTDEERPHGVSIVDALAEEWGVDGGTTGRVVWARLTW